MQKNRHKASEHSIISECLACFKNCSQWETENGETK